MKRIFRRGAKNFALQVLVVSEQAHPPMGFSLLRVTVDPAPLFPGFPVRIALEDLDGNPLVSWNFPAKPIRKMLRLFLDTFSGDLPGDMPLLVEEGFLCPQQGPENPCADKGKIRSAREYIKAHMEDFADKEHLLVELAKRLDCEGAFNYIHVAMGGKRNRETGHLFSNGGYLKLGKILFRKETPYINDMALCVLRPGFPMEKEPFFSETAPGVLSALEKIRSGKPEKECCIPLPDDIILSDLRALDESIIPKEAEAQGRDFVARAAEIVGTGEDSRMQTHSIQEQKEFS